MFQIISELSKSLQKNDLILPMAITAVRRTLDQLENLLVRPKRNGHLSTFLTALQDQMKGHGDDDDDEDENESAKFQVNIWLRYFILCQYYPFQVDLLILVTYAVVLLFII